MVSKPFTKSAMGECSGIPNLLSKRNGKITKNEVAMERGINNIKCTNKNSLVMISFIWAKRNSLRFAKFGFDKTVLPLRQIDQLP